MTMTEIQLDHDDSILVTIGFLSDGAKSYSICLEFDRERLPRPDTDSCWKPWWRDIVEANDHLTPVSYCLLQIETQSIHSAQGKQVRLFASNCLYYITLLRRKHKNLDTCLYVFHTQLTV